MQFLYVALCLTMMWSIYYTFSLIVSLLHNVGRKRNSVDENIKKTKSDGVASCSSSITFDLDDSSDEEMLIKELVL